jgi:hypothetical protein
MIATAEPRVKARNPWLEMAIAWREASRVYTLTDAERARARRLMRHNALRARNRRDA